VDDSLGWRRDAALAFDETNFHDSVLDMERVVVLSLVLFDPAFAGRMDERGVATETCRGARWAWCMTTDVHGLIIEKSSQPCYEKKIRPISQTERQAPQAAVRSRPPISSNPIFKPAEYDNGGGGGGIEAGK